MLLGSVKGKRDRDVEKVVVAYSVIIIILINTFVRTLAFVASIISYYFLSREILTSTKSLILPLTEYPHIIRLCGSLPRFIITTCLHLPDLQRMPQHLEPPPHSTFHPQPCEQSFPSRTLTPSPRLRHRHTFQ